ncbi:hypothetical protein R6Q59_022968 [Mikania micrantha]
MDTKITVVKADQTVFEGDSGGYYAWSNSATPLLTHFKLGAGKLLLHPLGFALPHYADSSKIGLVLQGTITVGMVAPNSSEEQVLLIKKGDAVPVLAGWVSWWFNGGDTDASIVFLGETTKALVPGQFTYFFVCGVLGLLAGFQPDFVAKTFGLDQKESENLANSQQGALLVKLDDDAPTKFPKTSDHHTKGKLYATIDDPTGEIVVKGGGFISFLTEKKLGLIGGVGLSAKFVKLEGGAVLAPSFVADGSIQICYVGMGSGRVKVVGSEGKPALDGKVEEGDLFIVPQFFAVALVADDCGIEVFSVVTSSKPVFASLAGNTSVWKALSPEVLEAALNVTPESEQVFKSKNSKSITIVSPAIK